MIACPSCGTLNVPGSTSCMRCRAALPGAAGPSQQGAFGSPPAQAGFGQPAPPDAGAFGQAPQGGGFGGQPQQPGYGQPPAGGGFGGQPPGGYGGQAPQGGGYGGIPPVPSRGIDVGDVLSSSYGLFKANMQLLVLLNAACALPGWLLSSGGAFYQTLSMSQSAGGPPDLSGVFTGAGLAIVGGLLSFVLSSIAVSSATRVGLDGLDGHTEIDFPGAITYGLQHILTTLGILFLTALAVGFGMVLCVVPGVIAACALAVSLPVSIAESKGAMDAMQRSFELTDGNRMNIFLVYLAMVAVAIGVMFPLMCCVGAMGGAAGAATGGSIVGVLVSQVGTLVVTIGFTSYQQMLAVTLYSRLTGYGTRTDGAAVAQVFG